MQEHFLFGKNVFNLNCINIKDCEAGVPVEHSVRKRKYIAPFSIGMPDAHLETDRGIRK